MAHRTEKPRRMACLQSLLPAFALLVLLSQSQSVMAQWSPNDAGGNTSTTGTGRVGIGGTPTKGKLHVDMDEGVTAGEHGIIYASKTNATGGVFMGYRANGTAVTGGYLRSTANLPLFVGTFGTPEAIVIADNGNIGIGVAPTKGKFEVRADLGVAAGEHGLFYASRGGQGSGGIYMGYRANGTAATGGYLRSTADLPLFLGTNATPEAVTVTNNGRVGVGTATPGMLNGVDFTPYVQMHFRSQATTQTNVVIDSPVPASGYVLNDSSQPVDGRIWTMTQSAGGGKLTFSTYTDAGTRTDRVVIDRAGNLGVGTLSPTAKMHVAGDVIVDGNISAKYQDVAEWVPSTQKLAAGTVVILDPERTNHVLASTAAYDTAVAGVVSEKPGLSLGEAGADKALVATTGRVKVRVDATRAPIKIGDLLVTSDVAGVAMKSEPVTLGGRRMHAPGTIIGKALEPLAAGTGEILVLLSLQ